MTQGRTGVDPLWKPRWWRRPIPAGVHAPTSDVASIDACPGGMQVMTPNGAIQADWLLLVLFALGGRILFHGPKGDQRVSKFRGRALREYRSHVQMVFQDPYSSLNPAKTIGYILSRPLANYLGLRGKALRDRVNELLETVALTPADRFINRFGYELSGGQRQRVVIARALAVQPQLIVADEPISSLDVSIRAEILELLNKLVQDNDVGVLYITHDLLSARMLSDEVVVLNNGEVVEQGPSLDVIRSPKDAYTKRRLDAIPNPFEDEPPTP